MHTLEETKNITLDAGEYWVKTEKVDTAGMPLYELWGTTRVFDGEHFVKLRED